MNSIGKISVVAIIVLIISGIYSGTVVARLIPKTASEVFLKGTVEKESDFNKILTPGTSDQDSITIINNTETNITYNIYSVDSERNNQNYITFKLPYQENLNLGKWVNFVNKTYEIPAHGNINIPFSINVPNKAFPGTYYGGIAIQKVVPDFASTAGQSVKVQTRNIIKLSVNIPGEISQNYDISNLTYNKDSFQYSFANKGNVIMTVVGEVQLTGNDIGGKIKTIKALPLKVLPGDSLIEKISFENRPIFGMFHASFVGKVYYFDGIQNKDIALNDFKLETDVFILNTQFLIIIISVLALIISIVIIKHVLKKKYLSECSDYIVGDNENIRSIATKFNMNWKKLAKINHIGEPYSLEKGQKIIVHNVKK